MTLRPGLARVRAPLRAVLPAPPPPAVATIVVVGAALRLVAVAGITPTLYVDSVEYRGVALLGGQRRPWTVPLLHAVVGDGAARVVAHALLGAAAWAALALVVADLVRHPRWRLVAAGAVTATGLVSPITNYDTTITSESVAISLSVLLFAAGLRLATAPTVAAAVAVVVVAVPFAFTRNDHPLLVTVLAVAACVAALRRRTAAWRVVAVGLTLTAAWSMYAAGRNDEIARHNLALVVVNRVLPDPEETAWFLEEGMPAPPLEGDLVLGLIDDPEWNDWASSSGRTTYLRWLALNPDHVLFGPWSDLFGLRGTTLEPPGVPAVLLAPGDRYGRVHPVLPEPVEALLWGGTSAAPVVLTALGLAVVALRRPKGALLRVGTARAVAVGTLVLAGAHLLLVWHASPIELGRHAMVAAVNVHVALLVLVAVTVDRRLPKA